MWLDLTSLIPLPVISLVALPWFTNFSTSLNLLFFYMTWSILVLSYPSTQVEIIGTILFRAIFFLLPATFFLALDLLLPSLSRNLKATGDDALPGALGGRRLARIVGWSVFNLLLGVGLHAAIELVLIKAFRHKSLIKVTTTIPFPWSIFVDVLWAIGVRGVRTFLRSPAPSVLPNSILTSPDPHILHPPLHSPRPVQVIILPSIPPPRLGPLHPPPLLLRLKLRPP
ncbi:MAG: hypothetical protein INR71_02230, partial [Terriglobus roseus]|nr:hypothetical protein [Terriglobus roseus]